MSNLRTNPTVTGVFTKLIDEASFAMAVPTCTVIIHKPNDPYTIAVIEQAQKHSGRLTLVGGKITGNTTPLACCLEEFDQEVGGKGANLVAPTLWTIKTDLQADVRVVTLKKATDGLCPDTMADVKVLAQYGVPDFIFIGATDGELAPKDGEAKSVKWLDCRTVKVSSSASESMFGAKHDLLICAYASLLEGEVFDVRKLSDLEQYRQELLTK